MSDIDDPSLYVTQLGMEGNLYPFMEDESGNLTGYGHMNKKHFSDEANRFDQEAGFDDSTDWVPYIEHQYAKPERSEDETFQVCNEVYPGAIPLTTLWGFR